MSLSIEGLRAEINSYKVQRDQITSQYHQLNGAIAVLEKQLNELYKDLEQQKKEEQEKAAAKCEEMKLDEDKLKE